MYPPCSTLPFFISLFIFATMKLFVFIFSFYVLALNCFPCGDSEGCNEIKNQKISFTAQQQEHQHETEACTPFCSCACCSAVSFYQPLCFTKMAPLVFKKINFHYHSNEFYSFNLHSVWQPPRIA